MRYVLMASLFYHFALEQHAWAPWLAMPLMLLGMRQIESRLAIFLPSLLLGFVYMLQMYLGYGFIPFFLLGAAGVGAVFGLPYALDYWIRRSDQRLATLWIFPLSLVAIEWMIGSNDLFGMAFSISNSQLDFTLSSATLRLGGPWLMLLVLGTWASQVAAICARWLSKSSHITAPTGRLLVAGLALLALVNGLSLYLPSEARQVNVAAVGVDDKTASRHYRHALEIRDYDQPGYLAVWQRYQRHNQDLLTQLTQVLTNETDLAIIPELAIHTTSDHYDTTVASLRRFAKEQDVAINAGILVARRNGVGPVLENRAVLVDRQGELRWDYQKQQLVPGGESLRAVPGKEDLPIVDLDGLILSGAICRDLYFTGTMTQAHRAHLILAPTWSFDSRGPARDFHLFAMRAAELGVALVLADHQAVATVDEHGRQGRYHRHSPSAAYHLTFNVSPKHTLYGGIGDAFAWICFGLLILLVGNSVYRTSLASSDEQTQPQAS